jgi:hypothetical protein
MGFKMGFDKYPELVKDWNNSNMYGKSLIVIVLTFSMIVILGLITLPFIGVNFKNGTGETVGIITDIKHVGTFHNTWEMTVAKVGSNGTGIMGIEPAHITVESNDISAIQEIKNKQVEYTFGYDISFLYARWNTESHGEYLTYYKKVN